MTDEVRELWDAEADRFDEQPDHGLLKASVREAWASLLLDVLPSPPASVLDLGSGTGSLSCLLAAAGFDVLGVDLSPRMVALADEKALAAGLAVDFRVGDAARPPVTGTFDVLLSRHVVWALDDVPSALERWQSLLADGGVLVLVEGRWHTGAGWRADELVPVVEAAGLVTTVRDLSPMEQLWDGPVADERYLVAAVRRAVTSSDA